MTNELHPKTVGELRKIIAKCEKPIKMNYEGDFNRLRLKLMKKIWCVLFHWWGYDIHGKPGAYCPRCNLVWTWGDCKNL